MSTVYKVGGAKTGQRVLPQAQGTPGAHCPQAPGTGVAYPRFWVTPTMVGWAISSARTSVRGCGDTGVGETLTCSIALEGRACVCVDVWEWMSVTG